MLTASTTWRMPSSETMKAWRRVCVQQALAGVDQQDGEVGVGGAGRHVAGVLLVAGRVGHDEGAPRRREVAVGDVDGDALLALGLEPVDQQREIDVVADRAVLLRVALERRELVVEDRLLLVEQPADQRRLAVVDRAAGEEAQRRALGAGDRVAGHQKYPSRFFFSIEPDSSRVDQPALALGGGARRASRR